MGVGDETLGIIVGIIGQGISALGLILQKKAHANIQARAAAGKPRKKWYADPQWLIAFLIFFGGNLLNVVALTFASQSIISALVVLVLVFNAIFAPILLKGETVQKLDVIGVSIIISGTVLVVIFGPKDNNTYNTSQLLRLWINTPFIIYGLSVLAITILLIIYNHMVENKTITPEQRAMIKKFEEREKADKKEEKKKLSSMTRDERRRYKKEKLEDEEDEAAYEKEMGLPPSKEVLLMPDTGPNAPNSPYNLTHRKGKITACFYAILPAILSSFNALFSKILGEVVLNTARGDNQFVNWPTYLFIVLFAFVDATQVVYLQRALRSYSALYIIPLYQVSLTIFGVATGGIYFKEFNNFSGEPGYKPALFVVGILLAVSGVGVLSKRKPSPATPGVPLDEADKKENISPASSTDSLEDSEKSSPKQVESGLAISSLAVNPDEKALKPEDAPPATVGTLFVYAMLSGVKWYVKGGALQPEGETTDLPEQEGDVSPTNPPPNMNLRASGSSKAKSPVTLRNSTSKSPTLRGSMSQTSTSKTIPLDQPSRVSSAPVQLDGSGNSHSSDESPPETTPVLNRSKPEDNDGMEDLPITPLE